MATVDWFAAEAIAAPAPPRRRTRAGARPFHGEIRARPKTRARRRPRRITGGIVWIAAFALLLAGVVAVNVAVLRANVAVNKLDQEQVDLQAQNQALASQVSSSIASIRIEQAARRFGLVPASASGTGYIDLNRK